MIKLLLGLFGGWKAIGKLLIMIALPIILYNLCVDLGKETFDFILSKINVSTGFSSPVVQITGLAGYFAAQLRLAECFAIIVSIYMLKFLLRKIPFIRW